jgi:hypothetical protein
MDHLLNSKNILPKAASKNNWLSNLNSVSQNVRFKNHELRVVFYYSALRIFFFVQKEKLQSSVTAQHDQAGSWHAQRASAQVEQYCMSTHRNALREDTQRA